MSEGSFVNTVSDFWYHTVWTVKKSREENYGLQNLV